MAKKRRQFAFQHIARVGPMLPTDVLERVANDDSKLPGLRPSEYGLAESERRLGLVQHCFCKSPVCA